MAYSHKKCCNPRRMRKRMRRGSRKQSIKRLSKRITTLARNIAPEKKRIDLSNANTTEFLGQVNINATNHYYQDVTPLPSLGASAFGRTGSAINIVSGFFKFQFRTQGSTTTPIKVILEWWHVKGAPQSALQFTSNLFNVNQWVYTSGGVIAGIIDYNSEMDPDFMGQSRILRRKTIVMPQNNFTSGIQLKNVNIGLKFKKGLHVRFNGDSATVADGQIMLTIRADSGNTGGSASTLTGLGNQTASSGLTFNFDQRWYYHDV